MTTSDDLGTAEPHHGTPKTAEMGPKVTTVTSPQKMLSCVDTLATIFAAGIPLLRFLAALPA